MSFELPCQDRHHRIVAKLVVVVEIFVAHSQAKHSLPDKHLNPMLDQIRPAAVGKAGGKALDKTNRLVRRTEKNGAGIRGDGSTRKISLNATLYLHWKNQTVPGYTLYASGIPPNLV